MTETAQNKFAELETTYREHKRALLPIEYEFLLSYSTAALESGRIRQAIEISREALSRTKNSEQQAFLYLSLARFYRMTIQMKNAQAELQRAFLVLQLEYPRPYIFLFLRTFVQFSIEQFIANTFSQAKPIKTDIWRLQLITALYEEAGLSAYYIRETLSMIICSLRARSVAYRIGPSPEIVNWLGATGCLMAILHQRYMSRHLLSQAKAVAVQIRNMYAETKQEIWNALSVDYLGDPIHAAQFFLPIAIERRDSLPFWDMRLVCTTLSCNYVLRGHMDESLRTIESMFTEYDYANTDLFSCNKTFIEWYKIPALGFKGEIAEVERIVRNSKAIFASVDKEKWQITQYLGNILIFYYVTDQQNQLAIREVIERFDALHLSPRSTFLEGCHLWVGKAYLALESYKRGGSLSDVRVAIRQLKRTIKHPSLRAHYFCVKSHLALVQKKFLLSQQYLTQARIFAKQSENIWANYEANKVEMLLHFEKKSTVKGGAQLDRLIKETQERGWKSMTEQLEKYKEQYLFA